MPSLKASPARLSSSVRKFERTPRLLFQQMSSSAKIRKYPRTYIHSTALNGVAQMLIGINQGSLEAVRKQQDLNRYTQGTLSINIQARSSATSPSWPRSSVL